LGFAVVTATIYPFLVIEDFDWFFTFSLVLIMSISNFVLYYVGTGNFTLLVADQRRSVLFAINSFILATSTAVAVLLIKTGFGIRAVMLGNALVAAINPFIIYFYAQSKHKIIKTVKTNKDLLKQRWDNFAQELSLFVCSSSSLVILSVFSNVYEMSVYSVYVLVTNGVFGMIRPFIDGVEAAFGNMFAKEEYDYVAKSLKVFEMIVFAVAALLLGVSMVMIVPFVMIYTKGITDVDYDRGLFAVLIVLATLFRCCRMPYMTIVKAVGHFRQTRNGAFWEMGLNIAISVVLAAKFGIVGVVTGMLFAMVFRTVQYAIYISKNVVKRSLLVFIKRIALALLGILLITVISNALGLNTGADYAQWAYNAAAVTLIAAAIVLAFEIVFYREDIKILFELLKKMR
jgi:O-antigen/teichoic acid export membrane protein